MYMHKAYWGYANRFLHTTVDPYIAAGIRNLHSPSVQSVQFVLTTHSGHSKLLQLLPVASYGYPSVHCHTTEIAG